MSANPTRRNRYLVSLYQGEDLKYQFRSLGADHREAMEVTKKFLIEKDDVDLSQFIVVAENKPLTIRLDEDGVEVWRVNIDENLA